MSKKSFCHFLGAFAIAGLLFVSCDKDSETPTTPEGLTVSANEWNFPAMGELVTEIGVTTDYNYEITNTADWLTVAKTVNGVRLTAVENESNDGRETEVVLSATSEEDEIVSVTISVTQDGIVYLTLSDDSVAFSKYGGSASVSVESNFDWETAYESSGWLTLSGSGGTLTVTVTTNDEAESRSAEVTVTAGDGAENVAEALITVTQFSAGVLAVVYSIEAGGTTAKLPLSGTVDCVVDWGDGSEPENVASTIPSHTYEHAGDFIISVEGTVTALNGNSFATGEKKHITSVIQWGSTGLESMENAFHQCSNLVSIPDITGDSFAKVTTFRQMFYQTGLTSIPADLFADCPDVTSFEGTFSSVKLESIPEGLFDNCTKVTTFYSVFPGGAFTTIPEGLFDKCTEVTTFYNAFHNCYDLAAIPASLFDNCTKVTNFSNTFYNCSSLTEIPEGLFDKCPDVTDFSVAFRDCKALVTVPTGLFSNCKKVTNFSQALCNCSAVTSESPYDMIDGEKVHLYERENHTDVYSKPSSTSGCFSSCSQMPDYASIPSSWGGGGE